MTWPGSGWPRAPEQSTFRRVFARLDAAVLDGLVGAFLGIRTATVAGRRVIAIDGRTLRGARTATTAAPHLVAAFDHASGAVLGQLTTAAKSNETPTVRTLLKTFNLNGVVVTVDAMHTQTDTATAITAAGGDYVFTGKANQPTRYAACTKLPWRDVGAPSTLSTGRGRRIRRTTKVVAAPTTRTAPASAPTTHPTSRPPSATPRSACSACPAPPTSPPACDHTPPEPTDPSTWS